MKKYLILFVGNDGKEITGHFEIHAINLFHANKIAEALIGKTQGKYYVEEV